MSQTSNLVPQDVVGVCWGSTAILWRAGVIADRGRIIKAPACNTAGAEKRRVIVCTLLIVWNPFGVKRLETQKLCSCFSFYNILQLG